MPSNLWSLRSSAGPIPNFLQCSAMLRSAGPGMRTWRLSFECDIAIPPCEERAAPPDGFMDCKKNNAGERPVHIIVIANGQASKANGRIFGARGGSHWRNQQAFCVFCRHECDASNPHHPRDGTASKTLLRADHAPCLETGITRREGKRGFLYYTADGRRIEGKNEIARLSARRASASAAVSRRERFQICRTVSCPMTLGALSPAYGTGRTKEALSHWNRKARRHNRSGLRNHRQEGSGSRSKDRSFESTAPGTRCSGSSEARW